MAMAARVLTRANSQRRSMVAAPLLLLLGTLWTMAVPGHAWFHWNYTTETGDPDSNERRIFAAWQAEWGYQRGPGNRTGYALVYWAEEQTVLMFGGRSNEREAQHIPTQYLVESTNGSLTFTSYEEPICSDEDDETVCVNEVRTGVYLNDLWEYDLSCGLGDDGLDRESRDSCASESKGWAIRHPGAQNGGCQMILGTEVCTVPHERWNAGAAVFSDSSLLVYGGYSHRCEDFCDDVWLCNLNKNAWSEVFQIGSLGDLVGKRWRFSLTFFEDSDGENQKMVVFGGHRLWHGFASDNSEDNRWDSDELLPYGGYLDDLWVFSKTTIADYDSIDAFFSYGTWEQLTGIEECFDDPDGTWEGRFAQSCTTVWPPARAGHTAVYEEASDALWVFGGYQTYFPYLSTDGAGSGPAIGTVGKGGFVPYPSHQYYLNDIWAYSFETGYWSEIVPIANDIPLARVDHSMILAGDNIYMFGGFSDGNFLDDLWHFNISGCVDSRPDVPDVHYCSYWIPKRTHIDGVFPKDCTGDSIETLNEECILLLYPKELRRRTKGDFSILPYNQQSNYTPDSRVNQYSGWIFDNASAEIAKLHFPEEGTPIAPYAATAPRQYVRAVNIVFNATHEALVYEWCVSVKGEPTRNTTLDGLYGRANESVFVAQPRRQAPGWDGCRDRADGRTDIGTDLQWVQPPPRAGHAMIYAPDFEEIILYGGWGLPSAEPFRTDLTVPSAALDDMWVIGIDDCPEKCNGHGSCSHGFCTCYSGYYGLDCSNISCPGDFCRYNPLTKLEECRHCCQSSHVHYDGEVYIPDQSKAECSLENPGYAHGICDGWGTCQCAPPFLGDDCTIKDCTNNCSFNGWCSVEFPVSRCMCHDGYFGDYCQHKECLNNCSFPNGVCNHTSGICDCRTTMNPYNNTQEYRPFEGDDCSYVVIYAAAPKRWPGIFLTIAAVGLCLVCAAAFDEDQRATFGSSSSNEEEQGVCRERKHNPRQQRRHQYHLSTKK